MLSRRTYCKALRLLRTQKDLDEQLRRMWLKLLSEGTGDVCGHTSWWLSETEDFHAWTADESRKWDLHEPEALYDFITGEYGKAENICGRNFVTVSILLDEDVKERLDVLCEEYDTTLGEILAATLEWTVSHPEEAKAYLQNLLEEDASCKQKN